MPPTRSGSEHLREPAMDRLFRSCSVVRSLLVAGSASMTLVAYGLSHGSCGPGRESHEARGGALRAPHRQSPFHPPRLTPLVTRAAHRARFAQPRWAAKLYGRKINALSHAACACGRCGVIDPVWEGDGTGRPPPCTIGSVCQPCVSCARCTQGGTPRPNSHED